MELTLDVDGTDDPIVTIEVRSPHGTLSVMGLIELTERSVALREVHVSGAGSGHWGTARLRGLMKGIMEKLDVDEILIEGAVRTTGANPGNRPRPLRFTRKVEP